MVMMSVLLVLLINSFLILDELVVVWIVLMANFLFVEIIFFDINV